MNKLLWVLLCVGCTASASAFPKDRLIDSLEGAYAVEDDARKRVDILLNLKDLTDSSGDEMFYTRRLFSEARAVGDPFAAGASLGSLASYYIARPEAADSLEIVLREVEPLLEGSSMEGLPAYYRMVDVARRIQVAGTEEAVRLSQNYVDSIRSCPPRTIYEEASQLFLKGIAAYKLGSAEGKMHMERGLPYWVDEMALLPKMKPTARRNFHANLITCLISVYGSKGDRDALVRTADDYLAMLDSYYLDPEVARRRPYIPKEMSYLTCYYAMCTSPLIERRQAQVYYDRYRRFVEDSQSEDNMLLDKYWFYLISVSYYEHWGDYDKAMSYNDSLILISRPNGLSAQLADMYVRRAQFYERMGHYKEACRAYSDVIGVRDSLSSQQYARRVGELEVRYGLDKAERDRALLLAQKRRNMLWFIAVILVFAIIAVVYLWRNLSHIKHLQNKLRIESHRALESDRLKRDFMGSMSHEIRTPLNAINGFAELIAEGGLSKEESSEFAQIIRDNTQLFTALINDMLEVSQLDNTLEELPRTPMDICQIIRTEVERLPQKEGVEYRTDFAEPEIVVPLHRGYVTELIRELLKNAVKFTPAGSVTIACSRVENGMLTISVTDTGCGIGEADAEKVFERFYKADPFAQGLGLGLSLCRLIAEKSGGKIRLDTSYTRGARFVVVLAV